MLERKELVASGFIGSIVAWAVFAMIAVGCWGCPHYRVWEQKMVGQAELAKAQQNRQIQVAEAEAEKESATLHADAEVERAKGVAEANKIIGTSLEGHDNYLRYLWITRLSENGQDVIYVPTEAGLPILESQRLKIKGEERETPIPVDPTRR